MAQFYDINPIKYLRKPIFNMYQFPNHYEYAKSTNILISLGVKEQKH